MRIYFSPIFGEQRIEYEIKDEIIKATMNEITDEFDFTGLPNGRLEIEDIETTLPIQPIVSAERVGGILFIELLNFISEGATEFERFPEWIDADDYVFKENEPEEEEEEDGEAELEESEGN